MIAIATVYVESTCIASNMGGLQIRKNARPSPSVWPFERD